MSSTQATLKPSREIVHTLELDVQASKYETMGAWELLGKLWHANTGLNRIARDAILSYDAVAHMAQMHPTLPWSRGLCRIVREAATRAGVS